MINLQEVIETNKMIEQENLDVRTITMGISLLDCADHDLKVTCDKIYKKITTLARDLVQTGEDIAKEFGIPIVNKRISITPISLVGGACCRIPGDYVQIAKTLDRAAKDVGVNILGGYSAIVSKGMTQSDELLIRVFQWHRLPPNGSVPVSMWVPPRRASTWMRYVSWVTSSDRRLRRPKIGILWAAPNSWYFATHRTITPSWRVLSMG